MFVCEEIWIAEQIQDQDAQIAQLATAFRDRVSVWYMKFHTRVPIGHVRTLAEINTTLILEFKKPKSQSQCITKLKEIKKNPNESMWDFDKIFKTQMDHLTFQIMSQQRKEWFIVTIFPHIRFPLVQ